MAKRTAADTLASLLIGTATAAGFLYWYQSRGAAKTPASPKGKPTGAAKTITFSDDIDLVPTPGDAVLPTSDGVLPPAAALEPKPGKAVTAEHIRGLGTLLTAMWPAATGDAGAMPPGALEIALAHAGAEGTGYGKGWDGEMVGSNNVGSYQATTATPYYRLVEHKDSTPQANGTSREYTTHFRF